MSDMRVLTLLVMVIVVLVGAMIAYNLFEITMNVVESISI